MLFFAQEFRIDGGVKKQKAAASAWICQVEGLRQRFDALGAGGAGRGAADSGATGFREEASESLQQIASFLYPQKEPRKAEDEVRVLSAEATWKKISRLFNSAFACVC